MFRAIIIITTTTAAITSMMTTTTITTKFTQKSLSSTHCSKCCRDDTSFNPHENPVR